MVSAAQVGIFIAALLYYLMRKPNDGTAVNDDNKNSDTSDQNAGDSGEK